MSGAGPKWVETIEFATPWFSLVSKRRHPDDEAHYAIRTVDYVCVVALTRRRELVLVRQYRAAVDTHTLELPAGHVEAHQNPAEAARAELVEETGFQCAEPTLLGSFFSDTGRNENRTWCFLATDIVPGPASEAGIETVLVQPADILPAILRGELSHAPHVAAVLLARSCHMALFTEPPPRA